MERYASRIFRYAATLSLLVGAPFAFALPDFAALKFPSGVPVPISNSAVGDPSKVPHPPIVYSWSEAVASMSSNGIINLPVAPEIGSQWLFNPAADIVNCPRGQWVLSYDDGPADLTGQFLNVLKNYSVPTATFFSIGANVVANPTWTANLKAVYDAGHQVALHSWTHRRSTNLTTDQFISEIIWTSLAIKQVIGKYPRYFRPPYGDTDDRIRSILSAMGLKQMIWNVLPNDSGIGTGDWNSTQAEGVFQSVLSTGLRYTSMSFLPDTRGYVSLEHELNTNELQLAKTVIPMIQNKSFTFVSAATCASGSDADSDRYFTDTEPFAKFLNSISLPFDVDSANALWSAKHQSTIPSVPTSTATSLSSSTVSAAANSNTPLPSISSIPSAIPSAIVTFGGLTSTKQVDSGAVSNLSVLLAIIFGALLFLILRNV